MSGVFFVVYSLFMTYIIPFIFAVGLIYWLYGIVDYHIIGGNGDEGKREQGRKELLWVFLLFTFGLLLYALISLTTWLGAGLNQVGGSLQEGASGAVDAGGDIQIEETTGVQQVPDVPLRNN